MHQRDGSRKHRVHHAGIDMHDLQIFEDFTATFIHSTPRFTENCEKISQFHSSRTSARRPSRGSSASATLTTTACSPTSSWPSSSVAASTWTSSPAPSTASRPSCSRTPRTGSRTEDSPSKVIKRAFHGIVFLFMLQALLFKVKFRPF